LGFSYRKGDFFSRNETKTEFYLFLKATSKKYSFMKSASYLSRGINGNDAILLLIEEKNSDFAK